jgi:hypothetical protein
MTKRHRFAVASAALLAVLIGLAALAWLGALTPSAPSGWAQVHQGMGRDTVLVLAGQPQQSGWPEKIVETWERNGLICRHRLLVAYRGQYRGDGYIESVCEGTWLRGYGWLHPRKELK